MSMQYAILDYTLLALGFGFVIFFHELGHFLAAKYVGIKVEQFAVGFGNAIVSFRKGLGIRLGSTQQEYQKRLREHAEKTMATEPGTADKPDPTPEQLDRAARELHIGETEYRWNWIPLGGYVKMLGQDDLNPNSTDADPRSYNMKPIRSRMLVVSAGVIMNVILAAVGFMIVFLMGFNVPPAMVGAVLPGSPADNAVDAQGQRKPLQAGDTILELDGKPQYDFTKIALNVALSEKGAAVPVKVRHPDGTIETLSVTPAQQEGAGTGFLQLGVMQPYSLKGIGPHDGFDELAKEVDQGLLPADVLAIKPGDVVTAVNGQPVDPTQYYVFDRALQQSNGNPVTLTVRGADVKTRDVSIDPHFQQPFNAPDLSFAGMTPRVEIDGILDKSPARGMLQLGDIVQSISYESATADKYDYPDVKTFRTRIGDAGDSDTLVDMVVLRDGKPQPVKGMSPTMKLGDDRHGLGITPGYDEKHAVIAQVLPNTPAQAAGLKSGMQLISIDGKPVTTWFDVKAALETAKADVPVTIVAQAPDAPAPVTVKMTMAAEDLAGVQMLSYAAPQVQFAELDIPRVTHNPLVAAAWGVIETRDFILQFYLTLQRMFEGSVSHTNMMGPIGIFAAGARFAYKGMDWLIWFLSMISANLAVVNFLPIPVVDGGLFTFLILEKLQGRPLSPKTQQVATLIGLALIISVFILVSYQDIMHHI